VFRKIAFFVNIHFNFGFLTLTFSKFLVSST